MKTLWMIEATCPRCGDQYNPGDLTKEYIEHNCEDNVLGGKPSEVWMYYLENNNLVREKKVMKTKLKWRKADLVAMAIVVLATMGLVWSIMDAAAMRLGG